MSAGTVTLTLSSTGQLPPCSPVTAHVVVTINPAATASTGGNQTICASQVTAGLAGTVGGGATGGTWTSSGTGTFSPNATTLNALYQPSAADKSAGTVTLTLSSTGQLAPCTPATAHLVVTIQALPAITGEPSNVTVCAGSPAVFTVTATGAALTYQWQVSRDSGLTFSNIVNNSTSASYTNVVAAEGDAGRLYRVIVSGACTPPVTSAPPALLTITSPATVQVGANQTVCASSPAATLTGTFGGGATTAAWSGAGSFAPNATTLNAVYTPTAAEIAAHTATVTLTASNPLSVCPPVSASTKITINPVATVNAGPNQSVCAIGLSEAQLAGSFGGAATFVTWSGGAGLFRQNTHLTNAIYRPTPAEVTAGSVTLTLTASGASYPCGPVSSSMTITYIQQATASAGPNQTICSSSATAGLGGTVGGGATGGLWTSSGTGTFAPNATTLNATYTPTAADTAAGAGTLTLTSTGQQPCAAAVAHVVVNISLAATASVGAAETLCSSSSATTALGGTVGGGATGGTWSASGTGTFSPNATTLNATYNLTEADKTAGTVTLTLTTTGEQAPCGAVTAQVVETIHPAATASAGGNQTICAGQATAAYTPSAADDTAGTVTLTLSTTGQQSPCGAATTPVVVTINALPAITSQPVSLTVCEGTTAIFSVGTTGTSLTYQW